MEEQRRRFARIASTVQGKAGEIGGAAADTLGKAAKNANDAAARAREHAGDAMAIGRQKLQESIYQPVFPEDLEFPKMVVIANEDDRKDVEACQGAVGWLRNAAGMDVLHLYEEVVPLSGLVFFPQPQLHSVYYRDVLDDSRYISLDCYFDTVQKDKFTELKRIAYELGAKSCRLESSEEAKTVRVMKSGLRVNAKTRPISAEANVGSSSRTEKRIVFEQVFENSGDPKRPKLEWFANDKEIEFLIDTRCNGGEGGMTKRYSMRLDSAATQTLNVDVAGRIDKALKKLGASCNFTLKGEALAEQRTKLVFEIEF